MEAEGIFPNSLYEANITLNQNQKKALLENCRPLHSWTQIQNPQQNVSKSNPTMCKNNYMHDQVWFIQVYKPGKNQGM